MMTLRAWGGVHGVQEVGGDARGARERNHLLQNRTHSREDELVANAGAQKLGVAVVLQRAVLRVGVRGGGAGCGRSKRTGARPDKSGTSHSPTPTHLTHYPPTLNSLRMAHQEGVTVSFFTARSLRVASSACVCVCVRLCVRGGEGAALLHAPHAQTPKRTHHKQTNKTNHSPRSDDMASCFSISAYAAVLCSLFSYAAPNSAERPWRSACARMGGGGVCGGEGGVGLACERARARPTPNSPPPRRLDPPGGTPGW